MSNKSSKEYFRSYRSKSSFFIVHAFSSLSLFSWLIIFYFLRLTRVVIGNISLHHNQNSFYSRPLKITGTSVSSQKENKERWGIILNHFIVNKPPDVSSKPTEKRGLVVTQSTTRYQMKDMNFIFLLTPHSLL